MKVFESFLKFIKTYKSLPFTYLNYEMTYRLFGEGERVILILMGSSMFPTESYFKIISPLAKKNRILTLDYPHNIKNIKELTRIVDKLLDSLGIHQITIFGASHGGSFAQAFAYEYPHKVDRLILYNTLTKTTHMNEASKQVIQDVLAVVKELEELRKVMPLDSVKGVFLEQVETAIKDESEIDLFEYMIANYSEEDEKLQMRLIKSFIDTYSFKPEDFRHLGQNVLIFYGHDNDPFGGAELIETLVELFDHPKLEFIESDRFSLMINADELIEKFEDFINEKPLS
ncbi:MAG: alpha/beta hydrolase [Acholeplasmataceae bacterium]|nr:alpha/beta hydrolase [Acholeplasmataceae bacterium]